MKWFPPTTDLIFIYLERLKRFLSSEQNYPKLTISLNYIIRTFSTIENNFLTHTHIKVLDSDSISQRVMWKPNNSDELFVVETPQVKKHDKKVKENIDYIDQRTPISWKTTLALRNGRNSKKFARNENYQLKNNQVPSSTLTNSTLDAFKGQTWIWIIGTNLFVPSKNTQRRLKILQSKVKFPDRLTYCDLAGPRGRRNAFHVISLLSRRFDRFIWATSSAWTRILFGTVHVEY